MSQIPASTRTLPEGEPNDRGVRAVALVLLAAAACFSIAGLRAGAVVLVRSLHGGF